MFRPRVFQSTYHTIKNSAQAETISKGYRSVDVAPIRYLARASKLAVAIQRKSARMTWLIELFRRTSCDDREAFGGSRAIAEVVRGWNGNLGDVNTRYVKDAVIGPSR